MKKKMTLTEATVRALQKEDKATESDLISSMKLYRKSLQYLDNVYEIMEGEDIFGDYSFSDNYYEAEEVFLDKLFEEQKRLEKLLNRVETDLISRGKNIK